MSVPVSEYRDLRGSADGCQFCTDMSHLLCREMEGSLQHWAPRSRCGILIGGNYLNTGAPDLISNSYEPACGALENLKTQQLPD